MTPLLAGVILAGAVCNTTASMHEQLAEKFHERPAFTGTGQNGGLFTLFISHDTWSWVLTTPQGLSCLLGNGDRHPLKPAGEPS